MGRSWREIAAQSITLYSTRDGSVIASYPNAGPASWGRSAPDASMLATGSLSGGITVHDLRTGKVLKEFSGHTMLIRSLAFSPDGTRLASASTDKSVRVWDVAGDTAPAILWPHTNKVWCVAFTPDGSE